MKTPPLRPRSKKPKTLPLERLAHVLSEGLELHRALKKLTTTLRTMDDQWNELNKPQLYALLSDALKQNAFIMPVHIPEAVAYLKANGAKLLDNRNRARSVQGTAPSETNPRDLLDEGFGLPETPIIPASFLDGLIASIEAEEEAADGKAQS